MNVPRWMVLVALSAPLSITLAVAAAPKVDPDKLPKVACSDLRWNPEFLAKYPKAPAACLEARVYKGKRYAKFTGKVYIQDPQYLTVTFLNVAGDPLNTFTYKPPSANAIVYIDGKPTKYKDIHVGDKLTVWVSEDRFAVYGVPGSESSASQGLAPK
jgi:hypothetical protein